jgi:leader peptidase (prepilin peptidase)/N-methyltransferase
MPEFLPLLILGGFGTRLSAIDIKVHRLPNRIVGLFAVTELAILGTSSLISADFARLAAAFGVAMLTMATYLILFAISRGALGMGDVKFAFPLGLCIGWYAPSYWLGTILLSFTLAGLLASIGIITKRLHLKSALAFGPYMFFGTLMVSGYGLIT